MYFTRKSRVMRRETALFAVSVHRGACYSAAFQTAFPAFFVHFQADAGGTNRTRNSIAHHFSYDKTHVNKSANSCNSSLLFTGECSARCFRVYFTRKSRVMRRETALFAVSVHRGACYSAVRYVNLHAPRTGHSPQ